MRRPRELSVLIAVGALCAAALVEAQQPARDAPAQTQRGATAVASATISGRVMTADTGRPVRRARVTLNAPELPGGRGALTDAEGRFQFTELPAGRYSVGVSKNGFVALAYGQRRPLQPGTPLQLNAGEQLRGIEFRLPRGSVISGQILDETGDPLAGASVRVMAYRYAQGTRQLIPAGTGITDDRGQYRVWGLNPGEYYVTAVARNFSIGPGPGGGGGGGRGGRGAPLATANVGGTGPAVGDTGDGPEQTGYAPTYYPGVESVTEARPVTVGLGAEMLDISFGVLLVRTSRITGRVVSSDGAAVSTGNVVLAPEGQATGRPGPGTGFNGRIQWDGAFSLVNVPPGRYVLRARGDDWDVPQFATVPLTVTGGDISGVNVVVMPGATLTGSVTFQRSQMLDPDPTQFRIAAPSADGSNVGPQQAARVDRSGRFTLEGVAAGLHWIRTQAPRGWAVKSVIADGRDVTDTPVALRSGQHLTGLSITFTDKLSEISGVVKNDQGAPVTEYTVLAFPDDSARWYPQSRFISTARPDQTGRYQLRGLPPGDYLILAVDPTEANEWYEPAFLEPQRAGATRLTIGEGDVKVQDVTVTLR